jgi:uncharacterized metal-binding protein YceD (DUF177 family)
MKIWLDQVREEPFSWEETESIPPETLERPELLDLGPVTWRGEIVYAEPGYLLRGTLSYDQTLACIRCLKPHAEAANVEVELMIVVEEQPRHPPHPRQPRRPEAVATPHRAGKADRLETLDTLEAGERELLESDLNVQVVEGEVFDTWPLVLEQLQLNIPMKPLCRPDCPGLCPRCGADLGAGECSCAASAPDPRWAALAALKQKLGDGGSGGA